MTQQQRLNRVLEIISERGSVSIAELSDELNISAATVRRDLTSLADQRLIMRTHGGASALGSGYELPLQYKLARQAGAKAAIAKATAEIIEAGSVVGLTGGTTVAEVARELARNPRMVSRGDAPGITMVTNALNIAYEMSVREHVKIVVTGGVPRTLSYELVGPLVAASLRDFAIDTAILGVDGISADFGATTLHEAEAAANRAIAAVSRRVVVVADSTKMGRSTFARICPLEQIDILITDQPLGEELAESFHHAGVETIVAHDADSEELAPTENP